MAGFKTHVTVSSALGAGYAVVGSGMGYDLSTALVAGGLCGVSGMLPDVDSDSGVPRREAMGFTAAIVPMLLVGRFRQWDLSHDQIVLLGATLYFLIRFVGADLVGRWSVHRGMWHSIPAVLTFAGIAFLITGSTDLGVRYFKAVAVGLGAMSHLVLDEIYSVDLSRGVPRFKKSFGTAIKLWGPEPWANFSAYAKLAVVGAAIGIEPGVTMRLQQTNPALAGALRGVAEGVAQLERTVESVAPHGAGARGAAPAPTQQPRQQAYAPPPYAGPSYGAPPFSAPAAAPPYAGPGFGSPAGWARPPEVPPVSSGFRPNRTAADQPAGALQR